MQDSQPLVSVILRTHDRPEFFPIALRCFTHQTYPNRELIVLDDSIEPVDESAVKNAGGRLIRMERGTTLGIKLNRGAGDARGQIIQNMDDDDWKGPLFLEHMVSGYLAARQAICRPTIAGIGPFLYFDVRRWEIRSSEGGLSQASAMFSRLDWEDCPFRPIGNSEDMWFFSEQRQLGAQVLAIWAPETFLHVRHGLHAWKWMPGGERFDDHLASLPLYHKSPEQLLPAWATGSYRVIHNRITDTTPK